MKCSLALLAVFVAISASAFANALLERPALLILPAEVNSESPFYAQILFRWEDEMPLRIATWALKEGESTLGDIQVFNEDGTEVQMIFPVTLPLMPNGEWLVKKGKVVKLGLYFMGWPLFQHEGDYYAVATFSNAFSNEQNVRFTTKKRWFKVTKSRGKDA